MVALAVPKLGATIPLSLHRQMLTEAHHRFDAGDYVGAGCRLREAINRYLTALCKLHQVKFSKVKAIEKRPPAVKLKALVKAGAICECRGAWMADVIDACNRLAHCEKVNMFTISYTLEVAYELLDDSPLSRGGVEGGES